MEQNRTHSNAHYQYFLTTGEYQPKITP